MRCNIARSNHILYLCLSVSFVPLTSRPEKIALWNVSTKRCHTFVMPVIWRFFEGEKKCLMFAEHMVISCYKGMLMET